MARLPDDTVLGQLPSANSGRPIAQYDTSSIGAGISNLGKGMSNAAWDIAKVQAKQQSDEDALDTAKAESQYLLDKVKLNKQVKDETDYNGLSEKYSPLYTQARDNAANLIRNPRAREQFLLKRTPDTQNSIFAVEDHAFSLQKDKEISSANDRLEELRNNALRADPAQRGQFIKAGNDLISGLVSSQYIDNTQAQKLRKAWTEKYAEGAISVLPAEEQINLLREAPKGKDAVLDRIGGLENATGDPAARSATSSAMGNFQFINSTWLDTVKKNRPDIANGRSDEDLLALRSDPKLSREMAGYLLNENESALKAQGIETTPGNLYLAHFLGAGAAAKVLKADKDTPVADIVGADAVKANQSILGGKTVGSVVGWAERKMGGTARGSGGLIDFIPEDKRVAMLQRAQVTVLNDVRKADSDAALEQYQVKSAIEDDIASMRSTGTGLNSINPETVARNFGSKVAQEWQDRRNDAHSAWVVTHDMSSLTDAQMSQRLASIAPKAGEGDFTRKQAIYSEAVKAADAVRKQRATDPAGSVNDDPAVRQANEAYNAKDPETYKAVIDARMAAQGRAGIPVEAQSPITKSEASAMTAPLRQMLPGQEKQTVEAVVNQFKQVYGDKADQALAYALGVSRVDDETSQQVAGVLRKLAKGAVPTRQEIDASRTGADVSAADKAVTAVRPANRIDPAWNTLRSMSDQGTDQPSEATIPAQAPKPTGVNVPAKAIRDLRANPDLASDFDAKYGKGASKRIFDAYPVRPKS